MAGSPRVKERTPAPAAKVFSCPSCGAGVTLRAQGLSIAAVCRACESVVDTTDENYQIISKAQRKLQIQPLIPLGQKGRLHGVIWEVVGYMERSDRNALYRWHEYLLFNPTSGFRWLQQFDGHWNFGKAVSGRPTTSGKRFGAYRAAVKLLGKNYFLFHRGTAVVRYVIGEFYWRVKVGEQTSVEDYISPPELLSAEKRGKEVVWTLSEYVEADTVKQAFNVQKPMPAARGVAPNQISTVSTAAPAITKYCIGFLLLLLVSQLVAIGIAKNELVYRDAFAYQLGDLNPTKVTPAFDLKHGLANVEVKLASRVQNGWLEVDAALVNIDTGKTYEFEQGVEYYAGRDYDGTYWSEGRQAHTRVLSSIPEGRYHLTWRASGTTPTTQHDGTPAQPYLIEITRDVTVWSNFLFALVLLLLLPVIVWWRERSFEYRRWSTSDFSPYWTDND